MGQEDDELNAFLHRLRDAFNPELVILFGSRASGEPARYSDYDLIIVSAHFEGKHWLDRIGEIVRLWDGEVGVDVLPYTPEEFERQKQDSSIVRTALSSGKTLLSSAA